MIIASPQCGSWPPTKGTQGVLEIWLSWMAAAESRGSALFANQDWTKLEFSRSQVAVHIKGLLKRPAVKAVAHLTRRGFVSVLRP